MAALPSTPLLAPGVVAAVPPAVVPVAAAVRAAVSRLAVADLAVVITTGAPAIDRVTRVDLAGLGRPGVRADMPTPTAHLFDLSAATGLPLRSAPPLAVDAASLALQLGDESPVVAMSVPATAHASVLVAIGCALVAALERAGVAYALIGASDGAAGLSPKAPRALVKGAAAWQQQFVAGVRSGATEDLAQLGPRRAQNVGARGWASTIVLTGAAQYLGIRLMVRIDGAPRGVGYLVADAR